MSTEDVHGESLQAELNALGDNLQRAIRRVWESEERKQLQAEMESGLETALAHLRSELKDFQESEAGERLKADLRSIETEIRSGETAALVRQEILQVMRNLNAELERAAKSTADRDRDSGETPGV